MKQIFIIAFVLSLSVFAKANYFRNYQMNDGLSSNSVWDIIQDSEGFLWFGTQNGLNRFDGKNFKTYQNQPDDTLTIGNNFIHSIIEDSQNRMLVGTSKGLYLFNRADDHFIHIALQPINAEEVKVNDIMEDHLGNIWVATHGSGLYLLNGSLEVQKHYWENKEAGSIPMNFIWTVVSDYKGNIWLGTAGKGLAHFDLQTETFTAINSVSNLNISSQTIYSLYYDVNNRLWIGTSGMGLFSYNYITGESKRFLEDAIIEVDKNKNASIDNSIFTIHRDHEGSFWIGTYFDGVSYFSPAIKNFISLNSLSKNISQRHIVSSMVETEAGEILIGTHNNNKLYSYNQENNLLEETIDLEYNNILSLLTDQDKLYAGLYGRGVRIISLNTNEPVEKININLIEGKSMFKTSSGSILLALESGGCLSLEPDGSQKHIKELADMSIAEFAEGRDGSLWVATHTFGVFRKKPDGVWTSYQSGNLTTKQSIISNSLNAIFSDTKGRIWIGTKESGLTLYNPDEDAFRKPFDTSNGMPSNKIYSIIDDAEDNIWVCTEGGIVRIASDLSDIAPIGVIENATQYNKAALRSSKNRLFFGGTNGFISIDPQQFVVNTTQPEIAITGFKIFNKEVFQGGIDSPLGNRDINNVSEITLSHNQSTFSFDLITLSFMVPDHNLYSYMLEGFDTSWNITKENKASYMNIPPGEYRFKVRGANNDGVWSQSEKSIILTIKPHFLLSPIMLILYSLIIIFLTIYSFIRYHRYVESKNQQILYKQKAIQEKEMYESKIEFFTNIAHEIRTPLSLISGPLETILISKDGNERTRHNLKTIERNSNRLLELVNQLLDFRKIENDMFLIKLKKYNLTEIVQKVVNQYTNDQINENIFVTFEAEKQYEGIVDAEAVFKIVSNLISNALKFTASEVLIKMWTADHEIFISVEDDGPGIDEIYQTKIFEPFYQIQVNGVNPQSGSGLGLPLAQSLAQKMGGSISVHSDKNSRTCFRLVLPMDKAENETPGSQTKKSEVAATESELPNQTPSESGIKILIVEDNKELRTFLKESLSETYLVFEAENGK
ncbi:MAG: hybrid sensor histidine kinase/response regulator, partial [Bacteroidales bacterium]|nr:hybrid sensor histidine kinase/response regulator [Bacteroidales bacterium]